MIDWTLCSPQDADRLPAILDKTLALGYTPKRSPTRDFIVTFHHKAHRRTLLKLAMAKSGALHVHLRFSACTDFSEAFRHALDDDLRTFSDRYAGCFAGCTHCDGTVGYTVVTSRGTFFRCHRELVDLGALTSVDLNEVFRCLAIQHATEVDLAKARP